MKINEWVKLYHTMIVRPIAYNKKMGFQLTNGMRIFFKEERLTDEAKQILKRHKERQESQTGR